jgi:hypothetical protein
MIEGWKWGWFEFGLEKVERWMEREGLEAEMKREEVKRGDEGGE